MVSGSSKWVMGTAAVWVVVTVTCVSGMDMEHQSLVQPQQGLVSAAEDGELDAQNGTETIRLYTYQPRQVSGEYETSSSGGDSDSGAEEVVRNRGSSSGGGGRQHSGSNRQYGGGRRQYGGRGARQGVGRQYGGGRRQHGGSSSTSEGREATTGSLDRDISQSPTDTVILMLQRLSDRLTGIEVLQRQQAERIGTINYRLTKIELQAEERHSITSDLSNSLRHRMETTDTGLDHINTQLDDIKTSITGLGQQYNKLSVTVDQLPKGQGNTNSQINGIKLQAVMETVRGLQSTTQTVKDNVEQLRHNLTALNSISNNLTHIAQEMVTKKYLHQNLNEMKGEESAVSVLARMVTRQPHSPRRGGSAKAEDCWQLMRQGQNESGVFSIQPRHSPAPFFVYCDMETDGGGWTVIQRREDGSVDFLREWADYKHGFGNVAGEYWLGNEKIHYLTNHRVSRLRVDLADFDQQEGYALYSAFAIGSELEGYSLKMLGQYRGDAGDSLRYHVGRRFSTVDIDNDAWPDRNCARDHMGAWWYRACETSNLNGRYLHGPVPAEHQYTGLYWYDFRGPQYSLWRSRMMVRRGGRVDRPVFKDFSETRNQETSSRTVNQEEPTSPPDTFDANHDPYVIFNDPFFQNK